MNSDSLLTESFELKGSDPLNFSALAMGRFSRTSMIDLKAKEGGCHYLDESLMQGNKRGRTPFISPELKKGKGGDRKNSGAVHRDEADAPLPLSTMQIRLNKAGGAWIKCADGTMSCETDCGRPILICG